MLLVADSGSTKCDWMLINNAGDRIQTNTMGFNPFFHNEHIIEAELKKNEVLINKAHEVTQIFFYGAGASSEDRNNIVANGLKRIFKNANTVTVDHDLKAAVIATAANEPGITCILGTGSNSCFYDGSSIHEIIPALGYVLGDEGSGSYFGKIILTKYLYKKLPIELCNELETEYGISKESIFDAIYNKPNPNVYLASFMKFAYKNKEHPFFKDMIYKGLSVFINLHVWCFENFREIPVHFVGSVAYFYKDVLEEVAKNYRFNLGKIIKKPVDSLADYYCEKLNYPILTD